MVPKLSRAVCLVLFWPRVKARIFQISVTGGGYGPIKTNAQVGDTVQVLFTVGTASFTQSTLDEPCVPKEGGLDSGTVALASGAGPQKFQLEIQNSDPIFFFNFAGGSTDKCSAGFVGTINASSQQAAQFLANAQGFTSNKVSFVTQTSTITVPTQPPKVTKQTAPTNTIPSTIINHSSIAASPSGIQTSHTLSSTPLSSNSLPPIPGLSSPIPDGTDSLSSSSPSSSSPSSSATSSSESVLPSTTSPAVDHSTSGLPHAILVVIGALVAMVVFGLSVLALFVYRRRRLSRRQSSSSFGDLLQGGNLRDNGTSSRQTDFFSWRPWQRLEDLEERRISPFTVTAPSQDRRPVSNATTLVSEGFPAPRSRQSEHFSDSDYTYASLSVHVPTSIGKRDLEA